MSVDLAHRIVLSLRRSARCKNTRVIYNDDYEEDDYEEGFGDERSDEEVDLDEPLIALKQKKEKISSRKAKRKTDTSSSPHATILGTSPKRDEISPVQTFQFESALHDSTAEKLERRAEDQEHSRIAIEHAEERAGEDICCAEMKNAVFHTCDHLSVVLHQFPIEDNGCGQQPGFITQPTEPDVSDAKAHLHYSLEQKRTDNNFSSLDPIDEVSNHQKSLDDTSNSDVNKSSVGNELLISSVNRSFDDHTDNNEFRYPEVVQVNTPERIKTMEESSPIDDFKTDMRCTSVVMQPDSCGSTDRIYTEHAAVVQMPVEGQLDSLACHGVKTKDISLHMNVEQAATGYNFAFDKTLDSAHTANFDTQDGRLENIVYGALNNNVQRKCFETKTSVGVPDTVLILSSPTAENVSHHGQLSGTMNDSYSNPEETQEISAGASISTPTCLGTDGQTWASDFFIDEGSISDHTPKKLLSQRKIMSPTSQEKFCNALAGIDLCGVQRLERKINLEECDASSQALPHTTNKQDRSMLTTDRKLKSRTSSSFTSKGVAK